MVHVRALSAPRLRQGGVVGVGDLPDKDNEPTRLSRLAG
jgi:hypothetical protein